MAYVAGAVMFVLFLAFGCGVYGGFALLDAGRAAAQASGQPEALGTMTMMVPAVVLWALSLGALAGVGIIAAILATRKAPDPDIEGHAYAMAGAPHPQPDSGLPLPQ